MRATSSSDPSTKQCQEQNRFIPFSPILPTKHYLRTYLEHKNAKQRNKKNTGTGWSENKVESYRIPKHGNGKIRPFGQQKNVHLYFFLTEIGRGGPYLYFSFIDMNERMYVHIHFVRPQVSNRKEVYHQRLLTKELILSFVSGLTRKETSSPCGEK